MKSSRRFAILIASLFTLLIAYQNCSEVSLLGLRIPQSEIIPTPEQTPEPQVDELPTPLPQIPSKPTEYNQETESTDECGGSYIFEERLAYDNFGNFERVIFQLKDRVTGQYIRPDRWESTTQGTPITNPPEYSLDVGSSLRGCDLVSIQAHFKNRCGDDVSLGYIFTAPGCPQPNPVIDVSCENITRPPDHRRLAESQKRFGNTGGYHTGQVSTLVQATNRNPTSQQIATDFHTGSPVWIKIPNGNYLSMSFTAPPSGSIFDPWVSGSGGCAVTMAISKCEGDFYMGRNAKNCLSPSNGEVSFLAGVGLPDSHPASRYACHLEPGEKYYLNIIGYDFKSGASVNESSCTWFGGVTGR